MQASRSFHNHRLEQDPLCYRGKTNQPEISGDFVPAAKTAAGSFSMDRMASR